MDFENPFTGMTRVDRVERNSRIVSAFFPNITQWLRDNLFATSLADDLTVNVMAKYKNDSHINKCLIGVDIQYMHTPRIEWGG